MTKSAIIPLMVGASRQSVTGRRLRPLAEYTLIGRGKTSDIVWREVHNMQYVTYENLFAFALVIVTAIGSTATILIAIFNYINNSKKK